MIIKLFRAHSGQVYDVPHASHLGLVAPAGNERMQFKYMRWREGGRGCWSVNTRACEDPLENHKNAKCLYHAMWQEYDIDGVLGQMMRTTMPRQRKLGGEW